MKNIINHFLIAFKPIKGFSLLATTDFILITVDGGSGGFNGDGQMHRILSGGGGNLLGGEGGCTWSIGGGGRLLPWGGGRGMVGLMKSFPLEEGKDLLTMGKKQMNVAIIALYMVGLRDHVVYFKFPRNIIKHYLSRKFISFETLKYV